MFINNTVNSSNKFGSKVWVASKKAKVKSPQGNILLTKYIVLYK